MNIHVVLPTRGNPIRLMAVLTCFDNLASGNHEITYNVVCDMDDSLTIGILGQMALNIQTWIGEGNLSQRMNQAARDGEIVTGAADDTFPLAQHWDEILCVGAQQLPVFSWHEVNDPNNQTMLVFTDKWLQTIGRMLPEYFPFWFGDTWVSEVYEMAFLKPLPIVANLPWGGKRGKTKGMRDLAYWFDFFAATRIERIAEARAICFAYDKPFEMPEGMLVDMKKRDAEQLAKVPEFNEWFGADIGQPSELYIEMKEKADQWLMKHQ